MKKLTNDQEVIDIVSKLVKDGAIDFAEAIKLLQVEVEKEYIYVPNFIKQPDTLPVPALPSIPPMYPSLPWYQQSPVFVGDYPPSTCDSGTIAIPACNGISCGISEITNTTQVMSEKLYCTGSAVAHLN